LDILIESNLGTAASNACPITDNVHEIIEGSNVEVPLDENAAVVDYGREMHKKCVQLFQGKHTFLNFQIIPDGLSVITNENDVTRQS
jgi:hypothetical protein